MLEDEGGSGWWRLVVDVECRWSVVEVLVVEGVRMCRGRSVRV